METYTGGDWVEYDHTTLIKGARMGSGRRMGIVASQAGSVVRVITNGPKPSVLRLSVTEILGTYRPATITECSERLSWCNTYGLPSNVRKALREARDNLRVRRQA